MQRDAQENGTQQYTQTEMEFSDDNVVVTVESGGQKRTFDLVRDCGPLDAAFLDLLRHFLDRLAHTFDEKRAMALRWPAEEGLDLDELDARALVVGLLGSILNALTEQHDALFKEAVALINDDLNRYADIPAEKCSPDPSTSQRLREAVTKLDEVLGMNPSNWPAMFFQGRAYRILGELHKSQEILTKAHELAPDQPDVAREAGITALDACDEEAAIAFTQKAITLAPDDAGLVCNLGLAYLYSRNLDDAHRCTKDAAERDPSDKTTAALLAVVERHLT